MTQTLFVVGAVIVGLVAGFGTHLLNQRLGAAEEDATEPALPQERLWAPILDGVLLGYTVYRFGPAIQALVVGVVILVLVQVLVFDARHRLILNRVIYPSIALALLASPISPLLAGSVGDRVLSAVLGAVIAGGLFFVLVVITGGGVGLGDAKLAFFMGAVLGFFPMFTWPVLRALLYGILLGGVIALVLLATRRRGMRDFIPYGPYLCLGGILVLLFPCGVPGPATC